MKTFAISALVALSIQNALAVEPTQGYYAGLSTLYPYKPVYCDKDEMSQGPSPCYGSPGDLIALPKSAPLPTSEQWCEYADVDAPLTALNKNVWYQWKPRAIPVEKQKYYGERVCYLEDRGKPMNLNEFTR